MGPLEPSAATAASDYIVLWGELLELFPDAALWVDVEAGSASTGYGPLRVGKPATSTASTAKKYGKSSPRP